MPSALEEVVRSKRGLTGRSNFLWQRNDDVPDGCALGTIGFVERLEERTAYELGDCLLGI